MPARPVGQLGMDERVIDDAALEGLLEQRQRMRESIASGRRREFQPGGWHPQPHQPRRPMTEQMRERTEESEAETLAYEWLRVFGIAKRSFTEADLEGTSTGNTIATWAMHVADVIIAEVSHLNGARMRIDGVSAVMRSAHSSSPSRPSRRAPGRDRTR